MSRARSLVWVAALLVGCTYDYAALQGTGATNVKDPKDAGPDASSLDAGARRDGSGIGGAPSPVDSGVGGGGGGRPPATGGETPAGGARGGEGGGATGGSATGGVATGGSGGQTGGAAGGVGGRSSTGGLGNGGAGNGGASNGGAGGKGGPTTDLVLRYAFDEKSGTTVNDTSGASGGPRNGTIMTVGAASNAAFSTNKVVGTGALALKGNGNGNGGYVTIPALKDAAPAEMTLALWINVTADANFQRVFDFGTGTSKYMFLSTNGGDGHLRFAITVNGNNAEQRLIAPTGITTQSWHHVAVVLGAGTTYTAVMYVDGARVVSNAAMTLHPTDLGMTTNNYLGRSAFAADPYFNGVLDDFRVYSRALSAAEISSLFAVRD